MKDLIRLHEEVRKRYLDEANPGELVEALIHTTDSLEHFLEVGRKVPSPSDEGILEAVHRVFHCLTHMHDPGLEDQLEFVGIPKEIELFWNGSISALVCLEFVSSIN